MRALVLFHYLSKALLFLAVIEPDIDKKRTLLQKALHYREINISRSEPLRPFAYWDNGVSYGYFAMIRASLASIEPNPTDRRRFLEEAIQAQEKCLQLMRVRALFIEKQGGTVLFIGLNIREMNLVSMLTCLHELSKEPEHLRRAIEASRKAIESARKVDNASRVAESYWRIAQAQDALGEHSEASESFQHASVSYAKAAEKIPQLGDFYQDYVSYMQAWSEIEKGKQLHEERDYGGARGHYEKAAALHKATKRWNYLYLNYHAWSRLEEAEHTSRREESEEAREAFQESGNLFAEAKKSIEAKLEKMEAEDEKKMASKLAKASESRRGYCQGRMALEEARILDRQGDHKASSRKYGSASDSFQSMMDSTEDESDRRELKPIIRLCQA
jgi:tetratricopeptide (TPR) repeat protein